MRVSGRSCDYIYTTFSNLIKCPKTGALHLLGLKRPTHNLMNAHTQHATCVIKCTDRMCGFLPLLAVVSWRKEESEIIQIVDAKWVMKHLLLAPSGILNSITEASNGPGRSSSQ